MAENENKTPETVAAASAKPAKTEKSAKSKEKKPTIFSRAAAWLRTTKAELKKIVWTPRKAVLKNTILVLVAMVLIGLVIGLLDGVFIATVEGLGNIFS